MHFECSVLDDGCAVPNCGGGRTIATLIGGALSFLLYKMARATASVLFVVVVCRREFDAGHGYFLFSGLGGIGDWATVIEGWEPAPLWRAALVVVGLVSYVLVTYGSLRARPICRKARPRRYKHAMRLSIIPYIAGALWKLPPDRSIPVVFS